MPSCLNRTILSLVSLLAVGGTALAAEDVPYGHPDFYPTPQRAAQLRGDGTGSFPGATVVDTFDFRTGKNIVWACPLPGWGYSSPIVVGDKAFVTCDWNKLVCIDVRTGEVLWAKENPTYEEVGGDKADELRTVFDQLTGPWLESWQAKLELAYLQREIDVIEAARAGAPLRPSPTMRKGKPHQPDDWGGSCPNDHLTDAEKSMLLAKASKVDDAQLAALKQRYETLHATWKKNQWGPQTSGYVPTLCPYARNSENQKKFEGSKLPCGMTVKGAFDHLQRHGIAFEIWNGWLARSFSTPVSDGTHVYAQFGQSQVVCYDLEGNRKWIKVSFDEKLQNYRQNDSASPLLVGDKLLVLRGGGEKKPEAHTFIRALDTTTGDELWVQRLDYVMSSHTFPNQTLVHVDGIDLVATSAGHILRVDDGKIIMKDLPAPIAPPLVVGNEVYLMCGAGQSNGQGSRMKITLNRVDGEIVGTINWAFLLDDGITKRWWDAAKLYAPELKVGKNDYKKEPNSNVAPLLIDGMVVNHGGAYDAATGVMKLHFGRLKIGASGHLIRSGNDVIVAPAGGRETAIYRADKLGPPTGDNALGSEWHRRLQLGQITLEEAVRNVKAFPWLPNVSGFAGGQTTAWPQGNRLYIRTTDTLYCIGDPKAAYHSPAAAPPAARTDR